MVRSGVKNSVGNIDRNAIGAMNHHSNINMAAFKKTQMMSFRRQSNMLNNNMGIRSNSSRTRPHKVEENSPSFAKFKDL